MYRANPKFKKHEFRKKAKIDRIKVDGVTSSQREKLSGAYEM